MKDMSGNAAARRILTATTTSRLKSVTLLTDRGGRTADGAAAIQCALSLVCPVSALAIRYGFRRCLARTATGCLAEVARSAGRRRRGFSADDEARIIEETLIAGAVVLA
jgi:hypothetical protein